MGKNMTNGITYRRKLRQCLAVPGLVVALSLMPFQQARSSNEEFVLNLKAVDIRSLIETVSQRTGKNFIVDPRVKATVTVIASSPINADKLYEMFLSVLDVHGFAAVPAGEMIKIVPTAVGVQSAVPVTGTRSETGDKLITQVVYLDNMPSQQMIETLRPLLPQTATIGTDGNTSTVIITERADNIGKLIELIHLLDQ